MMDAHRLNDDDLNAYVDGWLDEERRIAVERQVAEDPELAKRLDAYRTQNRLLHELFDPVLQEELPAEVVALEARLRGRLAGNDNVRPLYARSWVRAAAVFTLVCAGAAGGWLGRDASVPETTFAEDPAERPSNLQSFAAEAAAAHRFYTADEGQRGEMQADDPSAVNTFLSQRVGREVVGPDLSQAGYRLTGGRSLPTELGPGAQYVYASADGKRLTLLVGTAQHGKDDNFSFAQRGDMASFYWVEGGSAYALIGRLSRDELMDLTKAVYTGLKKDPRRTQTTTTPAAQPTTPAAPPPNPIQPVSDTRQPKAS
jgi:anti-sigma factor RsiW